MKKLYKQQNESLGIAPGMPRRDIKSAAGGGLWSNYNSRTAADYSHISDYQGAIDHFPMARASKLEDHNKVADFMCKIKVNKEEKVKSHLVSDV